MSLPNEIIFTVLQGKKVFPVLKGDKTPLVKWRTDEPASSDLGQIAKWFMTYKDTNWGLATGIESGLFVVDTDSKEGYDWVVAHGLTDTYSVKTGGNTPEKLSYGYHFYFLHPGGEVRIKNSVKDLCKGIDIRGDGGYVLIPPSITDMPYYVANQREIAQAPQWLIDKVKKSEAPLDLTGRYFTPIGPEDIEHGRNIYKKVCREYKEYLETTDSETNHANDRLNVLAGLAGNMVAAGCFDEEEALSLACEAGGIYLDENKRGFKSTWKSGFKWGLRNPWEPKDASEVFAAGIPDLPPTTGLKRASDVPIKPIRWIWPAWLPLGKMVIYAGPGGVGKSTVAFSWASTISKGGSWPDGFPCRKGRVLIWSGEDDPADTITPRLKAMGADLEQIEFIETAHGQPFDPAKDFAQLKVHFKPGDISLLIIDPIVSAVSGDMNKANEVRRGLQAIVDFASDLDCCVVGITHFNKSSAGKNPTERVTGSQAFTAFARMTLVGQKDQGTGECVIARTKSNISIDTGGLKYKIELTKVQDGIEATAVRWLGGIEGSAGDILDDVEPQEEKISNGKIRQAADWLNLALSKDSVAYSAIVANSGFSKRTLERAKKLLNIHSFRQGDEWFWCFDQHRQASEQKPNWRC